MLCLSIVVFDYGSPRVIHAAGGTGYAGSDAGRSIVNAFKHLIWVMDKFHKKLDVYTDLSAGGNHFVMFGKMSDPPGAEDNVTINPGWRVGAHSGATCIRNTLLAEGDNWGGFYFLNGVLEGQETQPKANWGEYADAGVNLTGATMITFWVKGDEGGENVEFFAFGVGRDPVTGAPFMPNPDSSPKVSAGLLSLTTDWQEITLAVSSADLSYVLGGFGWVAASNMNGYEDITFYLDDIQYDKARLNQPRFLLSYETIPSELDFDKVMKNCSFVYDDSLALIAFLATRRPQLVARAGLIAEALVYAAQNDRSFSDDRLRNAYQAGDLILPPGWIPNGRANTVRMPGWWDFESDNWFEDPIQVGTYTGNIAWAMLALLSYYEEQGGQQYLTASERFGEWVERECKNTATPLKGYMGGYEGWEPVQTKLTWISTEHNIDLYAAFMRLFNHTGDVKWRDRALHAKHFVESMWNAEAGHFWTGTLDDCATINTSVIPVDVQAWALMVFGDVNDYSRGIEWVEANCSVNADGVRGFSFSDYDASHVWFEGTAQVAGAYKLLGNTSSAATYLREIEKAQKYAPNGNRLGIVASSGDGLETGFGWAYYSRLHVGATAWYILAKMGINPFWGTALK